jgi:hypothetical protein
VKEGALPQTNDFDRHLCVSVDAEGYSGRDAQAQRALQADLRTILEGAANSARVSRIRWMTQDQGDGQLALVPTGADEPRVIDDFVRHVGAFLDRYNELRRASAHLRLRIALHTGVAYPAPLGFAGPAVVVVTRLLESDELHRALRDTSGHLAVILSPTAYEVVQLGHTTLSPRQFRRVTISVKGYNGDAWISTLDRPAAGPTEAPAAPAPPAPVPANSGIVISGGTVTGPLAAGDHATAVQYPAPPSTVDGPQ